MILIAYWFFYLCVYHTKLMTATNGMWHPALGAITPPPSTFCLLCAPSALTPRLLSVTRATARPCDKPASRTSSLLFQTFRWSSKVRGPPGSFSRLLSHPRPFPLAPAWPLVDLSTCPSAGSSLPHECGQGRACCGLDANRRQRICNSPQQHILPVPVYGDWNCHQYYWGWRVGQMCIHTLVSCLCTHLCVCVCVCKMIMLHWVIHEKRSHSGMKEHFIQ